MSLGALELEQGEGGLVARLTGELDMSNAADFGEQIKARADGAARLVVDLSGLTYFDSSGVRMLDQLVGHFDAAGRELRIVAPEGGRARTVLRICAFREDLFAG